MMLSTKVVILLAFTCICRIDARPSIDQVMEKLIQLVGEEQVANITRTLQYETAAFS